MFFTVLNSIAILVICMAVGFVCRKRGLITDEGEPVLSGLLVNVTLPCLLIVNMQKEFNQELFNSSMMVLAISFAIHFLGFFVGYILCKICKISRGERSIWMLSMIFSNLAYMGIPLIESIYGSEAVFYVSMCNVAFNILGFTLGIKIITMDSDNEENGFSIKKIIFNLPVWATVAGFLMFVFSITIPKPVYSAFNSIGNMTTPLSMIFIGAVLAKSDLKTVFMGWKMYILFFVRLLAMPLFMYFILDMFIADKMIVGILVILTGMPIASLTAILAAQYKGNRDLASKVVFMSTVLSIITIPVLSLILER